MTEIKETRWAMGLGVRAGKALLRAEQALGGIQAAAAVTDFATVRELCDARLELNKLAKEISAIVRHLEKAQDV